jgi:hypothetical protein
MRLRRSAAAAAAFENEIRSIVSSGLLLGCYYNRNRKLGGVKIRGCGENRHNMKKYEEAAIYSLQYRSGLEISGKRHKRKPLSRESSNEEGAENMCREAKQRGNHKEGAVE